MSRGSFHAFLVAQFLGAANDNLLKTFLTLQATSGVWRATTGEGVSGDITLLFTLPFLLLSGFAGQFADRYPKHRVIRSLKLAEVVVVAGALVAIGVGSFSGAMVAFVALAVQSALFGPAKYGAIPELVAPGDLSRANGAVNLTTNAAVIIGIIAGGAISDGYDGQGVGATPWLLAVSVAGVVAAWRIRPLPAHSPTLPLRAAVWTPLIEGLRVMRRDRPLWRTALAWASFYFVAAVVLSAVPVLGRAFFPSASEHHTEIAMLMAGALVGIGVSSLLAGIWSQHRIRLGLVKWGALAIASALLAFALWPHSYGGALAGLSALGLASGFYIVPLQALLQARADHDARGRVLGAVNALSFAFIAAGGGAYKIAAEQGVTPQATLIGTGVVMFVVAVVVARWIRVGGITTAA